MDVQDALTALRQELQSLDQQIGRLRDRQASIETTIAVLQDMGDSKSASEQPALQDAAVHAEPASAAPGDSRDAGPQAILRRLMADRPGVEVDSKAAHELLLAEGWQSTSNEPINVVRTALAAMAGRGEIVKIARGKYVYEPDAALSQPTAPGEALSALDLVESEYPSGSYSRGTALSEDGEMVDNPRRAHDPFAPRRMAVSRDDGTAQVSVDS